MSKPFVRPVLLCLVVIMFLPGCSKKSDSKAPIFNSKEELGRALFSDVNLSRNRSQSCATCHNPEHAFIDSRLDNSGHIGAVSLGDNGTSLGDRNAPTVSYAKFSPTFMSGRRDRISSPQADYQGFMGGQFHDGREPDLKGQAGGPPLNPIEMNMPDKASVVERLQENPKYVATFKALYGATIFNDVDAAYLAMTESIGKFEKTPEISPFDSAYDRYLAGNDPNYAVSKAGAGEALFFSQQFTNCATCHQLNQPGNRREPFSSYEYHNIGVPVNTAIRAINGTDPGFIDTGLLLNPLVSSNTESGKFKTPTLRNVAVTGPYMHNGVFRDLKTVIMFYDHFMPASTRTINPETGQAWAAPEVAGTVNFTDLQQGRRFTDAHIEQLVCFLRSLTDARYEHLIQEKGIDCSTL